MKGVLASSGLTYSVLLGSTRLDLGVVMLLVGTRRSGD